MKIKFKCKYCNTQNYFRTENCIVELTEGKKLKKTETYLPECNNCGKRNVVEVKEKN